MRPKTPVLAFFLILLAFLLRVYRLDFVALRGDEAFTVLFVQQPFAQMWDGIRTIEPNPPLLYLLLRAWVFLAGAGEFSVRFFSGFFGVLCVPLIYRAGREMLMALDSGSRRAKAGLFAAFLLAINPYQIWHSQDVRNYTLWPALSLAGMIFFFRWIAGWKQSDADNRIKSRANGSFTRQSQVALLFYTLFTLLSLFTHYYDAFIVLAQNLFVLIILWRRWRAWGEWAISQIVLGASFLAWAFAFSDRAVAYGEGSGIKGLGLLEILRATFSSFVLGETIPAWARAFGWIPFAVIALVTLFWLTRKRRRLALWLALYIAIPTLSVFLLNLYRPLFLERYLNGVAPAYYLLLALGLAALYQNAFPFRDSLFPPANSESNSRPLIASSPWRPLAFGCTLLLVVAAAVLALTNYFFNPVYSKAPDWRLLATYVRESVRSGDVVLQNFPEMSLLYYLGNSVPIQVLPVEFLPDARTEGQLATLARKYARVWFIPAAPDFWDPDHFVEQWLDSHSDMYQENAAGILRIRLYATAQEFLPARTPVQVHVDGFADLIGYRLARQAGRTRLVLYWKSTASTGMNYTVFAHALTRDEVLIAGVDNEPVHGTRPTSSWHSGEVVVDQYLLNADEPKMLLEVGMYNRATNLRVPLSGADGTRSNQDRFMIQTER